MDWTDLGKIVAPIAPTLGGLLGGLIPFPGGAIAGQALGNIIAKQFGVESTPAAVAGAIAASPNELAIAKLRAAADEAKAMWPALAEIGAAEATRDAAVVTQTNETMRVELQNRHWFFTGWRPMAGWIFDGNAFAFGVLLIWAGVHAIGGDREPLRALVEAWPLFLAYFGTLAAMVGVYIVGRSKEKTSAADTAAQAVPAAPKKR
jgi:hypothetical protein